MINLIPPEAKNEITYARRNAHLIRYMALSALIVGLLLAVIGLGYWRLVKIQKTLNSSIAAQKQQVDRYTTTADEAKKLTDNIATVTKLMDREVKFSELLDSITKLIPTGAVLTNLSVTVTDVKGPTGTTKASTPVASRPLQITAMVKDENTASVMLANLKASGLFETSDMKSLQLQQTAATAAGTELAAKDLLARQYPFIVTYEVKFKDAAKAAKAAAAAQAAKSAAAETKP